LVGEQLLLLIRAQSSLSFDERAVALDGERPKLSIAAYRDARR